MGLDPKAIRTLTESVVAFALAEAEKANDGTDETAAIAITAVLHAGAVLVADTAGPHADVGHVLNVADIAAGQVFNAVGMWHAVRTCAAPQGATVQ